MAQAKLRRFLLHVEKAALVISILGLIGLASGIKNSHVVLIVGFAALTVSIMFTGLLRKHLDGKGFWMRSLYRWSHEVTVAPIITSLYMLMDWPNQSFFASISLVLGLIAIPLVWNRLRKYPEEEEIWNSIYRRLLLAVIFCAVIFVFKLIGV